MGSVALDVRETENGYELEASVPGFRPEEIEVNVDRDTVTIRGQSQATDEKREGKNYLYRERRSGAFVRSIRLPEPVDGEKVEAVLNNGVLLLQIPRLAQTQRRRVEVRAGESGGRMEMNQSMHRSEAATQASENWSHPTGGQQSGMTVMGNPSDNQQTDTERGRM
jgi:HSP20 family molecular chaperone IbpA